MGSETNTKPETSLPEISIVVPVYHVEQYLRRCLDNILKQTMTCFELILINDGGTEEETRICEEYAAKDARIVYRRQENQGLSAARNTGLALCRGKWLMYVDSDDWVHPDFCRNALKAVQDTGAEIAVFDLAYTTGDSTEGQIHRSVPPAGVYTGKEILAERLKGNIAGYIWNKIYLRSLWKDIEFPVGENWEDDAVLHIILDRAAHIAVIHDVLYYKPERPDSITSEAVRTFDDVKWLLIQRRKRYMYLLEHHPDLIPLIRNNTASAAMTYCCVCRILTGDRNGFEETRSWVTRMHLYPDTRNPLKRFSYYLLMKNSPLFVPAARLKIHRMKKERGLT